MQASASEGNLSLSDDALESLASAFFAQAGVSGAAMTQEQFKSALAGRPELVASLKLGSLRSTPPVLEKAMSSCCWGCDWQVIPAPLSATRTSSTQRLYFRDALDSHKHRHV